MQLLETRKDRPHATPVEFRLRRDIQWQSNRDVRDTESVWIATDPLTRRIFRCGEHEYQLLQWLQESDCIEQVIERFHAEFAPKTIDVMTVQQLISRCTQCGLMRATNHSITQRLSSPTDLIVQAFPQAAPIAAQTAVALPKANKPAGSWLQWLASAIIRLVQTQISLGSPNRGLDLVAPKLGWLYSGAAVCFWMVIALVAMFLVGMQHERLWSELPSFRELRSPGLLVGFGAIFVITRFFHELGHAVACKRAGAACKDIGLMMSFGMMCPYVDISDSSRLSNRYVRMWIAVAGIYTELVLSAMAGLAWYATHPGWVHEVALQTMLVCSVTTILFNANPLMKYDGYYVLCDWLKIQGIREKSFRALDERLERGSTGLSFSMSLFLIFYLAASSINRLVMTCSIIAMIYYVAAQWQLAGLGVGFIALYLLSTWLLTAASWMAASAGNARAHGARRTTHWMGWIAVGLIVSIAINMPLPNRVSTWGSFHVGSLQAVYSTVAGTVEDTIDSQAVATVGPDSLLIKLRNEATEQAILDLESKWIRVNQQLMTMERTSYFDDRVADSIPLLQSQRLVLEKQLESKRQEQSRLAIHATGNGWFQPVVAKPADAPESPSDTAFGSTPPSSASSLANWTDKQSRGRFMERGTLVGWVVQDRSAIVECHLAEEQVAGISLGNEVRVRLHQNPTKIWTGKVVEMAKMSQVVRTSQSVEKADSLKAVAYQLRIEIDSSEGWSNYTHGNAEVVLLRPNQSILHMATDQWLRNMRMR
jgi:putative peptide zinc metalloprotease protein